jgi:Ca2+-binding RTX toxin-like protein
MSHDPWYCYILLCFDEHGVDHDCVQGTDDADILDASAGVTNLGERVCGKGGNDTIYGLGGGDVLLGGDGHDSLIGGADADWLRGGNGVDTARYFDSSAAVEVNLATGEGDGGTAEGDRLVDIENLEGSMYDDVLIGDDGINLLNGRDGNDLLSGGHHDDTLFGANHNDTLKGGGGADYLNGGSDFDTASYYESPEAVLVMLNVNVASGGDAAGDTFVSIENVLGSFHDDFLVGTEGGNVLTGLDGSDSLQGLGGVDTLNGGDGNDTLYGGNGNDALHGGNGIDSLRGGSNRDTMSGGSGADTFVFEDTSETGITPATADTILDFVRPEGDRISLAIVDADVYAAGNQAFTFIGTAAFSGSPGEVRYYQAGGDTYIELQTGTSPDVEGVIRLAGIHTPDASWFAL